MNVSKLTNPIYTPEPTKESTITPESGKLDQDEGTINEQVSAINNHSLSNVLNAELTQKESKGNEKERSVGEYKQLYSYLFRKYKYVTETSKVIDDFELYLQKLAKYQHLRNRMLLNLLNYIEEHETLKKDNNVDHSLLIIKLEKIKKKSTNENPLFKKLLQQLIELENVESNVDSRSNLNSFQSIIGIDDSLKDGLSVQESNTFPDLYNTNKFDFFELIKKNQVYENKIQNFIELNKQIDTESQIVTPESKTLLLSTNTKKRSRGNNIGVTTPVVSVPKGLISKPQPEEYEQTLKKVKLEDVNIT